MHNSPPSDGRRVSSSCSPGRRALDDSELAPEGVSYYPATRGYLAASVGELSSRGDSHHMSQDGGAHASGSQDSPIPPSGVAARPQRRTAAAEPSLLTFASQQGDDFWGNGPDAVVEEVMEEEEEEPEEGRDDWGNRAATPPPTEGPSEKVISIFKEVFTVLVATRQRQWSNHPYQWGPSLPVSVLRSPNSCLLTHPWSIGSSWRRASLA